MSLPSVDVSVQDGALGAVNTGNPMLVVIAPATAGSLNTPAAYATTRGIVTAFGSGTLVEAACYAIDQLGQPVITIRSAGSTAAAASNLVVAKDVGSTSVPTLASSPTSDDDYEGLITITTGGTIGTAGIRYTTSLDKGRTTGPILSLGTATSIVLGGATINFAAGTLTAGDTVSFITAGPQDSASDVTAALTALKANKSLPWELALIMSRADATTITAIDTAFRGLFSAGKFRDFIVNVRPENIGETQAQYATALAAIRASATSVWGGVAASAAKVPSVLTGRTYRRPVALPYAVMAQSVDHDVDIAAIEGHSLPVGILDANGSPDPLYHDENENPGLDDLGFITLRTWANENGIYVTNPRIFAPDGSDFDMRPLRRVMNLF